MENIRNNVFKYNRKQFQTNLRFIPLYQIYTAS